MLKPAYPLYDQRFAYTPAAVHQGNPDYLRQKFKEIQERIEAEKEAKQETEHE